MNKFEQIFEKVMDAQKKFETTHLHVSLDFNIDDLHDALIETKDSIAKKDAEIERLKKYEDKYKNTAKDLGKAIQACSDASKCICRLKKALFVALALKAKFQQWFYSEIREKEINKIISNPFEVKRIGDKFFACYKSELKLRKLAEQQEHK